MKPAEYLAEVLSGNATVLLDLEGCYGYFMSDPAFDPFHEYLRLTQPKWTEAPHSNIMFDGNGNPFFTQIGTYPRNGKPSAAEVVTPEQKKIRDAVERQIKKYEANKETIDGPFYIPKNDQAHMVDSLRAQAAKQKPVYYSTELLEHISEGWEEISEDYEEMFSVDKPAYLARLGGFTKVFNDLAVEKDAGVTQRWRPGTKKSIINNYTSELSIVVACRIILLATMPENVLGTLAPQTMVRLGLQDVRALFCKQEPHPRRKADTRSHRLIWVHSLVDTLCQGLLHKSMSQHHTQLYQEGLLTHSTVGMSHSDSGSQTVDRAVRQNCGVGALVTADATGWDLSVSRLMIILDAARRARGERSRGAANLILKYGYLLSSHVLAAGGAVYRADNYGITSSGQGSTSTQNSFIRWFTTYLAGSLSVVQGDDMVASPGLDSSMLERLGIRSRGVKAAHYQDGYEFTSHYYKRVPDEAGGTKVVPVFQNVEKMLWRLHLTGKPETVQAALSSYFQVCRHNEEALAHLDEIVTELGLDKQQLLNMPFSEADVAELF